MTPVTLALSPREVRIVECNGDMTAKLNKNNVYTLHPEYLSQIVVLGDFTGIRNICVDLLTREI